MTKHRGRETQEQRDRENSLARKRYNNGYSEFHHQYYAVNTDKYRDRYLTKVKPNLDKPEVKEHRNKLQQERRAKAKLERETLRKSMPFTEYKKLLAEKKKSKLKKKKRIKLLKEDRAQAGKRLVKGHKQQIKRVIQKLKFQRWLRKRKLKHQMLSDIVFVLNKQRIYRRVINKIRTKQLCHGETNGVRWIIDCVDSDTHRNETMGEVAEAQRKCG
jgi:hypothetical protein